jgi:calpain-15
LIACLVIILFLSTQDAFVGEDDRYSYEGVYQVRLFKQGQEEIIQLDDYIPCFPHAGPIYSRAVGNELWVLLLEKAFAKYNGSYASIFAGKPFEALIDLTG